MGGGTVRRTAAATAVSTACTNGPRPRRCCAPPNTGRPSSSKSPCWVPTSVSNAASATPVSGCGPRPSARAHAAPWPARWPTRAGAGPVGAPWRRRARDAYAVVRRCRSPPSLGWPGRGCGSGLRRRQRGGRGRARWVHRRPRRVRAGCRGGAASGPTRLVPEPVGPTRRTRDAGRLIAHPAESRPGEAVLLNRTGVRYGWFIDLASDNSNRLDKKVFGETVESCWT